MARLTASAPGWTPGQAVSVRGRKWVVAGMEPGADCVAVRLRGDPPGALRREVTLITPFDRLQALDRTPTRRVVRPRIWLRSVSELGAGCFPAAGLRAAAATTLRLMPYQLEPVLAIVRGEAMRLLIADAVGLGKTIEAGLVLTELRERTEGFRAVVLVPAGLREQWLRELDTRFGIEGIFADASWLAAASRELPAGVNPWTLPGVYVASHDFVKRPEVLAPLEEVAWDLCILDEAHAATLGSDRRAAAHAIARRAHHVVLLTATPPTDAPAEFEGLCRIGALEDGERILLFRRTRGALEPRASRRTTILSVPPTAEEHRMHQLLERYTQSIWRESHARGDERARLVAIVLRKRALSSAGSLARSLRRRLALLAARPAEPLQLGLPLADEDPLSDAEPDGALAAPGLADARREQRWLSAIAEAAGHAARRESKIRFLVRLLGRVREPVIVFTEFRDTLERLVQAVTTTGRAVVSLHGQMSPAERARAQRRFSQESLVLLATDAASEGLNLHAQCRVVIHYELPWTTARLEQRAGRVDRLGQERRVHEIALVAAHTSERLVLAPLLARNARARGAGSAPAQLVQSLSESRVAELVMGTPGRDADVPREAHTSGVLSSAIVQADLGLEAKAEVTRLEEVRRLARLRLRPSRRRTPGDLVIAEVRSRRPRPSDPWLLVYRIALSSRDGHLLHAECPVFAIHTSRSTRHRHSAGALRALAVELLREMPQEVRHRVAADVRRAVAASIAVRDRAELARYTRAEAISRLRGSTARRLVQVGLFDRRVLKQIASQELLARRIADEDELRLAGFAPGSPLAVAVDLAAVLRVHTVRRPE